MRKKGIRRSLDELVADNKKQLLSDKKALEEAYKKIEDKNSKTAS